MADTNTTGPLSGKTAWARNLETPLREFLRTETGSAGGSPYPCSPGSAGWPCRC